jgi:hypothetical protein
VLFIVKQAGIQLYFSEPVKFRVYNKYSQSAKEYHEILDWMSYIGLRSTKQT